MKIKQLNLEQLNLEQLNTDYTIIGGGIFGAYAALFLANKGYNIVLIEKEKQLFTKASIVNQARLHSGYHYPRSVATAVMSNDNKARFTSEHQDFIHFKFEKYYAIDRFSSFTDGRQFERFCAHLNIKCKRVKSHPLFNHHQIEALYATTEYSFDPILIARYYIEKLQEHPNITLLPYHHIRMVSSSFHDWDILVQNLANKSYKRITTSAVINATYAASNAINRLFGVAEIDLMHEISEMAFVTSPDLKNIGLTVMDGQFCSMIPYGLSGLLSLSSVAYTHHKVSYDNVPTFDCQQVNSNCQPHFTSNCNTCPAQPKSNAKKMMSQIKRYFSDDIHLDYYHSFFTIKSKLKANHIDDGRPTEISLLNQKPLFYCLFAGKINSIYEIEKIISD